MGFVGTVLQSVRRSKAGGLRHALGPDLGSVDKAILVAERSLAAVGMSAVVTVGRHDFYELAQPPALIRVADVEIRTAGETDLDGLCSLAGTAPALVHERLRRGDIAYAGFADGRLVCHIWFHRGPRPFAEDELRLARWALGPATFWAYAGAAADARGSGAFVDVFQTALVDLFALHGAERVKCRIRRTNRIAALLHGRIGFEHIGTMTGVGTPWLRSLVWTGVGDGRARTFVLGPNSAVAVPIPPPSGS